MHAAGLDRSNGDALLRYSVCSQLSFSVPFLDSNLDAEATT